MLNPFQPMELPNEELNEYSMKYFAKYLPVEGEIEVGEKYINKVFKLTPYYKDGKGKYETCGDYLVETREKSQTGTSTFTGRDKYKSKVKLFLCSRDTLKPIGEISNKAKWVNENDKFSENEVKICYIDDESIIIDRDSMSGNPVYGDRIIIKIKCKCCDVFM